MVQGLQYMIGMIAQVQSPRQSDYTEVVFCTRSDLNAGFYVDQRKLQAFIKSSYFSVFIQPSSLRLLSDLMISGQSYLRGNPLFERT
jgi:hypothetical protein